MIKISPFIIRTQNKQSKEIKRNKFTHKELYNKRK